MFMFVIKKVIKPSQINPTAYERGQQKFHHFQKNLEVIATMELTIKSDTYHDASAGDIAILQLCGPIDQKSVQVFESTILELYRKGICKLILDLSETKYLNSTGLGLLINIAHKVNVVGGGIKLINVAEKFKVLFDMLGLDSCLPILTTQDDAIHSFGGTGPAMPGQDSDNGLPVIHQVPEASSQDSNQPTPPAVDAAEFLMGAEIASLESQQDNQAAQEQLLANLTLPEDSEDDLMGKSSARQNLDKLWEIDDNKSITPSEVPVASSHDLSVSAKESAMRNELTPTPKPAMVENTAPDKPLLRKTLAFKSKDEEGARPTVAEEPTPSKKSEEQALVKKVKDEQHDNISLSHAKQDKPSKEMLRATPKPKTPYHIIKRKTTVRYYSKMNSQKTYPMAVVFSQKFVPATAKEEAAHDQQEIPLQNPVIQLVPRVPGCQVVPEKIAIDIATAKSAAEFWLTPSTNGCTQGEIPAWIEVCYENKPQEVLALPFKIVHHAWTWVCAIFTFFFAIMGIIMERFHSVLPFRVEEIFPILEQILQNLGGWRPLALICSGVFFLLTIACFLVHRDREALPAEKASSLRMH